VAESDLALTIVVAAVIRREDGRILLARRPDGRHMAGLWEFPGGKVRRNESPVDALRRELAEELAVVIEVGEPLTFAIHEEPGLRVLLLFFRATISGGAVTPCEGQEIAWVERARLADYPTPPADQTLIELLKDDH
jgi:8-oxo-dGTP diphosphatase